MRFQVRTLARLERPINIRSDDFRRRAGGAARLKLAYELLANQPFDRFLPFVVHGSIPAHRYRYDVAQASSP